MIIAFVGYAGSGKDTAAKLLAQSFPTVRFSNQKFAAKLKEAFTLLTGRTYIDTQEFKNTLLPEFGFTVREFLLRMGDGCRETVHKDIWVNSLLAHYDRGQNWIVTDCRYKSEVLAIENLNPLAIVRIVRPDNPYPVINHITEYGLDDIEFPTIINDGDEEQLHSKIIEFFTPLLPPQNVTAIVYPNGSCSSAGT